MKKLYLFLLSVLFTFIFSSCASKSTTSTNSGKKCNLKPSVHAEIPDTSSTIVTTPQNMNLNLSSLELTRLMGNGINLGNTMEAYRPSGTGTSKEATSYEQIWGQPVTSKEMIQGYKNAGFDSLRIPVAWTNVMDFENGNYVIGKTYLDRIETLVNYALDANMYVIINDHWDGGWWGMFGSATEEIRDSAKEMYIAMWTQIGNRFQNYSEKLIFEGGNEEIGNRLNDNNICWDSGALESEAEQYEEANKINQIFVDTIRNLGGNNPNRFLLIPGFNTDVEKTCDNRWKVPSDTATDKLLISVHYYSPSPLCIGNGDDWGSKQDIQEMNTILKKLEKFTTKGHGVIIGEYGVLPINGKVKKATTLYHSNFLDNCDVLNICPVLWDTGNLCYYNKSKYQIENKELSELYLSRSFKNEADKKFETIKDEAQQRISKRYSEAPNSLSNNELEGRKDIAIAYIMYADANWSVNYSVGDEYKPNSKTKGIEATDVAITEPGEYSVSLDFSNMNGKGTSKASGFSFSALGIANGEVLHPDWVIEIKSIKINEKEAKLKHKNYTSSDNGICTRSNIVNDWVSGNVKGRTVDGSLDNCAATIIDKSDFIFQSMKTYEITFYYGPANN